ncbi:MAG: hypothetical protein IJO88_02840 [Oscillospiraceae bacterium]|nr:hypothetical protein [Oscillospiraceae bacterium]
MERFLKAAEGMVLTDGRTVADCVYLAEAEQAAAWQEVTAEEAARLAPAEAADYEDALRGFGVMI